MADIIHLLPDSVANQIAAGEVIQRPSSVIKELIENSIDAGADTIKVYVSDAGKSQIQVIDNGKGMSETDARMAFERHATSKIFCAEDLFSLKTMGFRGEALASIAAVAQVELKTKTEENDLGISIEINGGKFIDEKLIGCPLGSNFIVKNLFYNIPARRRFLKSDTTELNNIIQEYERVALANPQISFKLFSNEILISDLRSSNFRIRIKSLFGKKLDQELIPIQISTDIVKISGFVGTPISSKKKGSKQFFIVNGRFMKHSSFSRAIQNAFDRLIPEGNQVPYFVNFSLNPELIDVNIHPTKTEIKFQDEKSIWQILHACVREALATFNIVPMLDFDVENKPVIPNFDPNQAPKTFELSIDRAYNPFTSAENPKLKNNWEEAYNRAYGLKNKDENLFKIDQNKNNANILENNIEDSKTNLSLFDLENELLESPKQEISERSFFQHLGKYIVVSVNQGLLIINQQLAHIRILYDQFEKQFLNRISYSQTLLYPEEIEITLTQENILNKFWNFFTSVGFDFKKVKNGIYNINSVPIGMEITQAKNVIIELLDSVEINKSLLEKELTHKLSLSLAKNMAISDNQVLDDREIKDLLDKLFDCEMSNFSPDGQKIQFLISQKTITEMC